MRRFLWMFHFSSSNKMIYAAISVAITTLIFCFQNCGPAFTSKMSESSNAPTNLDANQPENDTDSGASQVLRFKSLTLGNTNCAIEIDGRVRCWGGGRYVRPRLVEGLAGVNQIAMGATHICFLIEDGTVKCLGSNSDGQLGHGGPISYETTDNPVQVVGLSGVIQISMNATSSCAVTNEEKVYCWGSNVNGALADNSKPNSLVPVLIPNLINVRKVAVAGNAICALSRMGDIKCWGRNFLGQLGRNSTSGGIEYNSDYVTTLTDATDITAGEFVFCAVVASSKAKCWGSNSYGLWGTNIFSVKSAPHEIPDLSGVKQLDIAGNQHFCALLINGEVQCWGDNSMGQLGDGKGVGSFHPVRVKNLSSIEQIGAGHLYSCALTAAKSIRCWGKNSGGELGNNEVTNALIPVVVDDFQDLHGISQSFEFGCGITSSETLSCWGDMRPTLGTMLSLYIGSDPNQDFWKPKAIPGSAGVKRIALGRNHVCYINDKGKTSCWGSNLYGQTGSTKQNPFISTATQVESLIGVTSIDVSAGNGHTCIVTNDNTVKCWGANTNGELGRGNFGESSETAADVIGLTGAVKVSAQAQSTCALLSSGQIKCWGLNVFNQLGNFTRVDSATPVEVSQSGNTFVDLASASHETCGITNQGKVKCWGEGVSTTSKLEGLIDVQSLSMSHSHGCALLKNSTVQCWGYDQQGQLGFKTDSDKTPALPKLSEINVQAVTSISFGATFFKRIDGSVKVSGILRPFYPEPAGEIRGAP